MQGNTIDLELISDIFSIKTNKDTIKNFCNLLVDKNIPFELIGNNIVHFEPTKVGYPMFVAHTDTVCDVLSEDVQLIVYKCEKQENSCVVSDESESYLLQRQTESILGADDRSGVFIIVNEWLKGNKINFALTSDEEIGAIGASELEESHIFIEKIAEHKIGSFIEFDRKGYSDIIEYCASDLTTEIQKVLTTYKPVGGVFTDLDKLANIVSGVNLSVGYFNAHSKSEYQDLGHLEYLCSKIVELEETLKDKTFDKFQPYAKYYNSYNNYGKYYDWDFVNDTSSTSRTNVKYGAKGTKYRENDYCLYCGQIHERVYFMQHVEYGICLDCIETLQKDIDDIIEDLIV